MSWGKPLGRVVVELVVVGLWAAPLVLAKLFADPLDATPYVLCALVGLALGVGVCFVLRAVGVGPRIGIFIAIMAFAPTYAVAIGLGINRAFDRSVAVDHPCRVLGWHSPAKSRAYCQVTSWRGRETEKLADELIFTARIRAAASGEPRSAGPTAAGSPDRIPRACVPGSSLLVSSHPGRLGWEWIESVRPRS